MSPLDIPTLRHTQTPWTYPSSNIPTSWTYPQEGTRYQRYHPQKGHGTRDTPSWWTCSHCEKLPSRNFVCWQEQLMCSCNYGNKNKTVLAKWLFPWDISCLRSIMLGDLYIDCYIKFREKSQIMISGSFYFSWNHNGRYVYFSVLNSFITKCNKWT